MSPFLRYPTCIGVSQKWWMLYLAQKVACHCCSARAPGIPPVPKLRCTWIPVHQNALADGGYHWPIDRFIYPSFVSWYDSHLCSGTGGVIGQRSSSARFGVAVFKADEPWLWLMDLPWYQSRDSMNTSTENLADEPTLADGPPSTRTEMQWIPVHKTWQMNLLWPMDPTMLPEQRCLAYQYTKLGRWTYFGRWTP